MLTRQYTRKRCWLNPRRLDEVHRIYSIFALFGLTLQSQAEVQGGL